MNVVYCTYFDFTFTLLFLFSCPGDQQGANRQSTVAPIQMPGHIGRLLRKKKKIGSQLLPLSCSVNE